VRAWIALALVGAALLLPLLGMYGLWDPHEVHVADIAREMAHTKTFRVPPRFGGKPALVLAAISAGYRVGTGELAARLPVALLSLAALLATFYAGTGILRRRAALFGAFALLTMPIFFLGARQITSAVGPILSTALAIGGLARAAWPARGESAAATLLHLVVGAFGLVLGQFAAGFGLGVAVPLVALALALLVSAPARATSTEGAPESDAPAAGMVLPRLTFGLAALASVALTLYAWWRSLPTGATPGYSWVLGGIPHAASNQVQATTLLKAVGFGAFPWIAIAPLAVARLFGDAEPGDAGAEAADALVEGRAAFGRYLLVAWVLACYIATTLYSASVADTTFGAYAGIALLAGAALDDAWESSAARLLPALLVLVGAVAIAHDFFMTPEGFAGVHVLEGIKWPPLPAPPYVILVGGIVWAALACAGLVAPRDPSPPVPRFLDRRVMIAGSLGAALLLAGVSVYWIVPEVSKHLSYKGLFVKYKALVGTGSSEIGKYHVPGQLSDYAQTTELASLPQMFEFFGKRERVFVITAADDLPAIDQYARQKPADPTGHGADYFVIDDSNSKFLMLSNQLGGEADKNPLRRFVFPVAGGLPRQPQHPIRVDFEGKVELVGYDLPDELERGKAFKIAMFYKVNAPVGGSHRVFIHFDGPGTRFNGDHTPLDGKFPANYWVPGYYIIDEFTVTPDRMSQPAGMYTIFTGFWQGDSRLKITSGPSDGDNRARIGAARVK
jgi:4-amino-4-deoxy-L-arabinose transferase-like glycosyltransferase